MPKAGSQAVGSQLTNVDNVSFTSLGVIDVTPAHFQTLVLDVAIVYGGDPGASKEFTLYWAWDSHGWTAAEGVARIGGIASDGALWTPFPVALASGAAANAVHSLQSVRLGRGGERLHVGYKCDDLTTALTTVDVRLFNDPGEGGK